MTSAVVRRNLHDVVSVNAAGIGGGGNILSIKLIFPEGGLCLGGRARAAFIWLRLAWLTHRLEGEEGGEGWIVEGTRSLSSAAGFGEENPFLTLISFSILLSSPLFFSLPSSLLIYVTDMMSSADDATELDGRRVASENLAAAVIRYADAEC